MVEREIPAEIKQSLRHWAYIGNTLRTIQIILGVIATAAGLYVATFTELNPSLTRIGTYIAAFCLGMLSAFNIGGKADSMRRAYRYLTAACILYKGDQSFSLNKLVEAYKEAEIIVGDVPFHGHEPRNLPTEKDKNDSNESR